ncbi:MAG: hypothetical protein CVU34_07350 [Betaproteobacteria bacterium HGW-Betaproteobacteria-7]|jgi:hypothetical protein|nr:MAG: hypothetical protein CVU34_07350 [Betaproteobacteria bacterium HGW-Betaproteobacteria-7]
MADIFLSYTEKDREAARQVATLLEAAGWSVWWDRRIPAGETWRSVLEHALEGMRCMIVLWTARSIESEWVYEEATEGRRQGKLVPVLLEAVRPPAGFREIQAADLTGWDGSADFHGWRMLLADLEHLLSEPADTSAASKSAGRPDTGSGPAYDPADLPGGGEVTRPWPWRRPLIWALAGLVPLAGAAYFGLKQPPPEVAVEKPDIKLQPPVGPISTVPPALPKPPAPLPEVTKPLAKVPAPTLNATLERKPPTTAIKRPASSRCADLLTRIQLGESLSEDAQALLQKECSP